MNCPHHIQIYAAQPRSYRELPLRLAEFGTVYRYEQSGELSGLTRVRGFTQDDAHLFCTHEQVRGEFRSTHGDDPVLPELVPGALRLSRAALQERSQRSQVSRGRRRHLEAGRGGHPFGARRDETALRRGTRRGGVLWSQGRFHRARTASAGSGSSARCSSTTCCPERFGLEYIGPDNQPHRPVMIHRAPLGSMERFMGILIEHFAGAFPLWLAPEQVRVLPISDKVADYAQQVLARLLEKGFRATLDLRAEKIGAKIRDAQLEKIPAMLVVGRQGSREPGGLVPRPARRRPGGDAAGRGPRAARGRVRSRQSRAGRALCPAAPAGRGRGRRSHLLNSG